MELAGAVVGLTLFGLWVDYHFRTKPIGVLVGATLGVVGGLYNFVRDALRMTKAPRPQEPPEQEREDDDDAPQQ